MKYFKIGNCEITDERTLIMGVLNVTPDSFSDGNLFFDAKKAVVRAKEMVEQGADMIDIGGESTRPGAEMISVAQELRRVQPVIEKLAGKIKVPISIDTYKPEVASVCLGLGADMVNDISGLRDARMREIIAENNAAAVIMHMQGNPQDMQQKPEYDDVVLEIRQFLLLQKKLAAQAGIKEVIIDPGIGFGKTLEHNLILLKKLKEFKDLEGPVLVGPSRKSFIGKITGLDEKNRLEGTIASVVVAALNGANIVRVHDVKECKRALMVCDAIRSA